MIKKICIFLFSLSLGTVLQAQHTLSYHRPSKTWMGALPLGNGRLGGMVRGGVEREIISLNESSLWSGETDPEGNNLCGPDTLKRLRELFFENRLDEAHDLANRHLNGHGRSFGTHLPLGDLWIETPHQEQEASRYMRSLDMQHGVATVSYEWKGTRYEHQCFFSNPSQVMAVRYTASRKNAVSLRVGLDMLRHSRIRVEDHQLVVNGDARFDKWGPGGVEFEGIVRVIADGGTLTKDGESLKVENAHSVWIISDIRTNWRQPDYVQKCQETVDAAQREGWNRLLAQHRKDFRRLYDRMDIQLGDQQWDKDADTEQVYQRVRQGERIPAFDALFFRYGRYMLISSSREDSPLCANLQGIWNDNLACNMPWTCDYHLDINIQQNYWSANVANLPMCNQPLFRTIGLFAEHGAETARSMYGCRGWVAHTVNNIWGATYPANGLGWSMNVSAGAWLATHLWTHYEFTQDQDYLREVGYPLLKKTAEFFVDYMTEDPRTGYLVTGPSISPENAYKTPEGGVYSLSMMPAIDREVVYEIYHACIESAKILHVDEDFRKQLEKDILRLPPLELDKNGLLKEWQEDVQRQDPLHRHASHLLALYPFSQITLQDTPVLAEGCRRFLQHQMQEGWEDTEWTRGNTVNFYARLHDGEKAYESVSGLYQGFMRENLMTVSPAGVAGAQEDIFSFDATEAVVAGMAEMLLQSHRGELHFLPALPAEWHEGKVSGLCARGGIVVDFSWKNGKVNSILLRAPEKRLVKLRVNGRTLEAYATAKGKKVRLTEANNL